MDTIKPQLERILGKDEDEEIKSEYAVIAQSVERILDLQMREPKGKG